MGVWTKEKWEETDIVIIAKCYLGMLLMYTDNYDQLDRVDQGIITSPEMLERLKNWTDEE